MSDDDTGRRLAGPLDRRESERADPQLIPAAMSDADTLVLVVHGDRAPVTETHRVQYVTPAAVPDDAVLAFLGRDAAGRAVLAAVLDASASQPFTAAGSWLAWREAGGSIDADDGEVFVTALSLGRWLLDAAYCPACGTKTDLRTSGWARHCPNCGREHFPRTDPAVIVAVTSAGEPGRLLLGSNAVWGEGRYSCFAGFVEAGESLEATVHREVEEEAGVRLRDVTYFSSQPWPYPRSLMVGFHATAVHDADARPDGEEIISVRWFSREEIGAALRGESEITLPGAASIAHRLIVAWQAG